MDDTTTKELSRMSHRARVVAYAEAQRTLIEACDALVRAAERVRLERDAVWEEAWRVMGDGGDPGPMPMYVADTDEGERALESARRTLHGLL